MHKIGDFSSISKTPIKTLRYYEKENLLVPALVNETTGYRYYETKQLIDLAKIVSYRQVGMSIRDIKELLHGKNTVDILVKRKKEIEENLMLYSTYLSKINYLLEEENMNNKIIIKEIPDMIVYYKEGRIDSFDNLAAFILKSAEECLQVNPDMKCNVPDYCYVNYLDNEYKEENIHIRYSQAVTCLGVETDTIKFTHVPATTAICMYHKGAYDTMRESYTKILRYVDENGYEMSDFPRECYIDGCWNKENEYDYVTEIQVPVSTHLNKK